MSYQEMQWEKSKKIFWGIYTRFRTDMAKIDKKRRSSLLNKLKKDGLNPEEEIISTKEYDEVIKSILDHMKDVGGYSSDQVREDIEAIINLKSANDTFFEVNRLQSTNKKTIVLVPILFTILLLLFILVLLNNAQDEFAYGLGFLTFMTGGLGLAFRQDYKKTEEALDRLVDEIWAASENANEVKARLGIKEIYKSD